MVEIRDLSLATPATDIGQLVDLYVNTFRSRSGIGDEQLTNFTDRAKKTFELAKTNDLSFIAYEDAKPVGFLLAGKAHLYHVVLFNAALAYIKSRKDDQEKRKIEEAAFFLTMVGDMALQPGICINPRNVVLFERFIYNSKAEGMQSLTTSDSTKWATAVAPKYQGNGIATALNEALEARARECGARAIATTCTDDPAILGVNEKRGYQHLVTFGPYYGDGSPVHFMVKVLEQPAP